MGGSDGDRSRANTLSFLHRTDALWLQPIPQRRRVGTSQRYACCTPRRRKLDHTRMGLVTFLAGQGRSLREIAADVGVSHETVRAVLRSR